MRPHDPAYAGASAQSRVHTCAPFLGTFSYSRFLNNARLLFSSSSVLRRGVRYEFCHRHVAKPLPAPFEFFFQFPAAPLSFPMPLSPLESGCFSCMLSCHSVGQPCVAGGGMGAAALDAHHLQLSFLSAPQPFIPAGVSSCIARLGPQPNSLLISGRSELWHKM